MAANRDSMNLNVQQQNGITTIRPSVGVLAHMPRDDGRPDLFEIEDGGIMAFPCAICKHAGRPESECRGCIHCAL
jgi:hypothetical protein